MSHILALAQEADRSKTTAFIRVIAPPGFGKSALTDELELGLRTQMAALVLRANLFPESDAIGTSASALWLASGKKLLTEEYSSYLSGLEGLLESASGSTDLMSRGFVRLIDALSADHLVCLLIDDAQWCDDEARETLHALAALRDRRLIVVAAHRPSENLRIPEGPSFRLGALTLEAGLLIVREHYPGANDQLADAIVRVCGGMPLNLVLLASQARHANFTDARQLHGSLASTIEADLSHLDESARSVLQACALMREPISYRVLTRAFGEPAVAGAISFAVPRYMVHIDTGFRFDHILIRDGIRDGVISAPPLQRALLDALGSEALLAEHEHRDAVDFARSLGERQTAISHALELARIARSQRRWDAAALAYESAFAVSAPMDHGLMVPYYDYAVCLRILERYEDAQRFLEPIVIEISRSTDRKGLASLAGCLSLVFSNLNQPKRALSVCDRYLQFVEGDDERAELLSIALTLRALTGEPEVTWSAEFESLVVSAPSPRIEARMRRARAVVNVNLGLRGVEEELALITAQPGRDSDADGPFLEDVRILGALHTGGVAARDALLDALAGSLGSTAFHLGLLTLLDFSSGNWSIALSRVREYDISRWSSASRALVLVPCAAMLALGAEDAALRTAIAADARRILALREISQSTEILLWHLLADDSGFDLDDATALLARWMPVPATLDEITIEFGRALIADKLPPLCDAARLPSPLPSLSAWSQAQTNLRLGWVNRDAALLEGAERELRLLGATALANLALRRRASDVEAAPKLNTDQTTLTPREQEVCLLLREGLTNRAIAHRLFVSEKTVATHVSNALSKFGARTRTELAMKFNPA